MEDKQLAKEIMYDLKQAEVTKEGGHDAPMPQLPSAAQLSASAAPGPDSIALAESSAQAALAHASPRPGLSPRGGVSSKQRQSSLRRSSSECLAALVQAAVSAAALMILHLMAQTGSLCQEQAVADLLRLHL